jgi:hemerythrin-like domain-containing protein
LERDLRKARDTVLKLRKHRAIARRFGEQMERERDEERTITFRQADCIEELERECDEANKELHKRLAQYDTLFDEADKIRKERDEARDIAQDLLEKNAKQAVNIVRWRECAEGLALAIHRDDETTGVALGCFDKLKETSK